jgi:hypothetical protein
MDRSRQWRRCVSFVGFAMFLGLSGAGAQYPGDITCDGITDTADLAALVGALYAEARDDCPAVADVNWDGTIDSADLVGLLRMVNAPPPQGPVVTFFGVVGADGVPIDPLGEINGVPVFFRNSGSGFKIVAEGASGPSGTPPGTVTFDSSPTDPSRLPDLLIESSALLGDGSPSVCDGGVPAVHPLDFGSTQAVANALNDFSCNFTVATSQRFACTQDRFGDTDFLGAGTQAQFCLQVSRTLGFTIGDSIVSLRLRDSAGNLGPLRQMIVRVSTGPVPATFTVTPTATPVTPRPTRTPTASWTPTSAARPSPTRTRTSGRTPGTPTATVPPTTGTRTPAAPTPTSTRTSGVTATRTRSRTPTRTVNPSPTTSPTPAAPIGPVITFFGLTLADDSLVPTPTPNPDGIPVYQRLNGTQFSLVIEGFPGPSGADVGVSAYQMDLSSLPDLQVEVSQDLGDGSPAVCDRTGPMPGGVPKTNPPTFNPTSDVISAVNDLGCRFRDGSGVPVGRTMNEPCTRIPPTDDYSFVNPDSTIQFCGFIDSLLVFPPGDTVVTARLRDRDGNPGAPAQLVIHIGP